MMWCGKENDGVRYSIATSCSLSTNEYERLVSWAEEKGSYRLVNAAGLTANQSL